MRDKHYRRTYMSRGYKSPGKMPLGGYNTHMGTYKKMICKRYRPYKENMEYIEEFCKENDLVLADNSNIDQKATKWAIYTIDDRNVGIYPTQISPWLISTTHVYNWIRMIEYIRGDEKDTLQTSWRPHLQNHPDGLYKITTEHGGFQGSEIKKIKKII